MSEVELIEKTVKVAKESSEVFDALTSIVTDAKAGYSIPDISARNLPKLVEAVRGYEQFDDEAKSKEFVQTLAYGVGQVGSALRS